MSVPRIKIDLHKICDNTRCLVERLKPRGIIVTGVTNSGHPISGLHTDAFTLLAEVIETKIKLKPVPLKLSDLALSAQSLVPGNHWTTRSILALGLQDTDPAGLTFPAAVTFAGATSDHIVVAGTKNRRAPLDQRWADRGHCNRQRRRRHRRLCP